MAAGGTSSFSDLDITLKAGADLSALQYTLVKLDTAEQQIVTSAAIGDPHIGVLQNKPKSGEPAQVRVVPGLITKGVAGAAISAGDELTFGAGAKFITRSVTERTVGHALQAAGADGEIIEILWRPVDQFKTT